jgi:hypothetical protein
MSEEGDKAVSGSGVRQGERGRLGYESASAGPAGLLLFGWWRVHGALGDIGWAVFDDGPGADEASGWFWKARRLGTDRGQTLHAVIGMSGPGWDGVRWGRSAGRSAGGRQRSDPDGVP